MNSLLKKNLESLNKINEYAVKTLEELEDSPDMKLIHNKNGDANISFNVNNKIELAYPDDMSPVADAKGVSKIATLYKEDFTVLIGVGAGHLLYQMLKKKEQKHHILLIEPKPEILRLAFQVYDFSKWIEDNSLLILLTENKNDLIATFAMIEGIFVTQGWAFYTEKYVNKCFPEIYNPVISDTMNLLNSMQCNIGTVCGAGAEIAKNDILNLPYVIRSRGVVELKDLYKDKPCVCIATGPSLSKNIHLLKDIQGDVIIVAVAQALRLLLAHDIKPDFITSVDFGNINIEHFNGLMDSDTPLVILNRSYADIIKRYQGPKFIVGTPVPGFEDTSVGIIAQKGSIDQGGSVAHMNLGLATFLGCNPITLIGQDLGYEDVTRSHVEGADAAGKVEVDKDGILQWKVDDPRSHLSTGEHKENPVYPMGGMYVEGYFGKPIMTNNGLLSFITAFENMASVYKEKDLCNSTEGGANIKGYKKLFLKDFIEKYCKEPIDKSVIKPLLSLSDNADVLIDKVLPLLKDDIKLYTDIIENCTKALEVNDKMKVEKDPKEKIKQIKENEKYSIAAQELTKKNNLMGVAIYHASRAIYSREYSIGEKVFKSIKHVGKHLSKNDKDLAIAIARNELILKTAKASAIEFKGYHETVVKLLEDYKLTKDETLLTAYAKEPISFDDVDKYFEVGNWAHPLLDSRRILTLEIIVSNDEYEKAIEVSEKSIGMRTESIMKGKVIQSDLSRAKLLEYNELIEESHKIGKDTKDYDKTLALLKKAVDLMPERFEARWGYATSLNHTHKIDEALEQYESLIKDFPDNELTLKFEYACVMIQRDIKEGLKLMGEVMTKTDVYDHMLNLIGNLYGQSGLIPEAITAYENYLKKYPADINVWNKLQGFYIQIDNKEGIETAMNKIKELS
jgi:hypothetical protein